MAANAVMSDSQVTIAVAGQGRPPWWSSRKIIGAWFMSGSFFATIALHALWPDAVSDGAIESLAYGVAGTWTAQAGTQGLEDAARSRRG